jgi:ATP-dependent HslUV protease ATP-binding subunit HslU
VVFSERALRELARVAYEANTRLENIGARRLHTVMEALLDDVSFRAPERKGETVQVDEAMVRERLGAVLEDEDLSRYIL